MYKPNTEIWQVGYIVIHSGDEPLHRYKERYKLLMVVLSVSGRIAETRYINIEEMRENRNIEKLRVIAEENCAWLLKKYSFEKLQGIYNLMYEKAIRQVYTNDIEKLHRPSEHGIFISTEDLDNAENICMKYKGAKI